MILPLCGLSSGSRTRSTLLQCLKASTLAEAVWAWVRAKELSQRSRQQRHQLQTDLGIYASWRFKIRTGFKGNIDAYMIDNTAAWNPRVIIAYNAPNPILFIQAATLPDEDFWESSCMSGRMQDWPYDFFLQQRPPLPVSPNNPTYSLERSPKPSPNFRIYPKPYIPHITSMQS